MRLSSPIVLLFVVPVFGFGCRGCQGIDPNEQVADQFTGAQFEGDDPGECTDQVDNDRDTFFDCKDQGCWGHPACDGQTGNTGNGTGNTGTGTGTGTGTTTEVPCVGEICDITSVAFDYEIVVYVAPGFEGFGGICSCTMQFAGEADVFEVRDLEDQITLGPGRWEQTNEPVGGGNGCNAFDICECPPPEDSCEWGFETGIWWDKVNRDAYQSLQFDPTTEFVLDWVVHDVAFNYLPSSDPMADSQFYITSLNAPYDASEVSPVSVGQVIEIPPDLALFGIEITHNWTASFTKTP